MPLAPLKNPSAIGPVLTADSALAYDVTAQTLLYEKNSDEKRPMASIGKLMTAMVILDAHKMNEVLTVSKKAASMETSKVWFLPGEQVTIENALYGLLIQSGNDAAFALAEFDALTEENFVKKMNAKAKEIGLTDTHFTNAPGFDAKEHYSTASDILRMSMEALKYPFIRKAVQISTFEIPSADGKLKHKLETTNKLLNDPLFKLYGLKTGTTEGAGPSFVGLAKSPNKHEILTVILGSNDRFQETKVLLNWLFRAYDWK